jgi:hypothetical protein
VRILLGLKLFVFIHICKCGFQRTWSGSGTDVFESEGLQVGGFKTGTDPPPWGFLRKDVILRELYRTKVQGCDSKGVDCDWKDRLLRGALVRISFSVNTEECITW